MEQTIDRTSAVPYYLQLGLIVERQILNGDFSPEGRLPSETELCRTFDLSRSTVRETFRYLQKRNLIKMIPRRGAFVIDAAPNDWMLQVTRGFFETAVNAYNRSVETTVLRSGFEVLPLDAAKALRLPEGATGFVLERLRKLDGVATVYSTNYLSANLGNALICSEVLLGKGSLNKVLADAGYTMHGARRAVTAVIPSDKIKNLMQIGEHAPLLLITSTSWEQDGMPFDYYCSYVRSDVVTVAVEARSFND